MPTKFFGIIFFAHFDHKSTIRTLDKIFQLPYQDQIKRLNSTSNFLQTRVLNRESGHIAIVIQKIMNSNLPWKDKSRLTGMHPSSNLPIYLGLDVKSQSKDFNTDTIKVYLESILKSNITVDQKKEVINSFRDIAKKYHNPLLKKFPHLIKFHPQNRIIYDDTLVGDFGKMVEETIANLSKNSPS